MFIYIVTITLIFVSTAVSAQLPQLRLPWGTWEGTPYPQDPNIYIFKNVRFGAKPERFSAPEFPDWTNDTIQENTDELSCFQITTKNLKNPPGGRTPLGDENAPVTETEDCLFLDLYVPATAFEPGAPKLPVSVWIYGGAFAFGSKTQFGPLYTGQSLITAANYQTIFVAGNYRVGAFGWLAGSYMESVAQPNAGLYDQALLFEWVQEYIALVGGDATQVSAWGESAGASSILHHLVRQDGTHDPLFQTFFAQSPGFEWAWDNSPGGKLDQTFSSFSKLADCGEGYDISCLREAEVEKVQTANQELFNVIRQTGLFPVGPAVDGNWVKSIPAVAFSRKKTWQGIQSAVISHCANEAFLFLPKDVDSQEKFDEFVSEFLPGPELAPQRDAIRQQYDCEKDFGGNFTNCIREVIQDLSFTCNTRNLFDSYPEISYMMEYAFPLPALAVHASDLIPLFANSKAEAVVLLELSGVEPWQAQLYGEMLTSYITPTYQNYLASFALAGDPNALPFNPSVTWPVADGSEDKLSNVMRVQAPLGQEPFVLASDDQNSKSKCDFWTNIAQSIVGGVDRTSANQKIFLKQAQGHLIDL